MGYIQQGRPPVRYCYICCIVGIQATDSKLTMRDITELVCMALEEKEQEKDPKQEKEQK